MPINLRPAERAYLKDLDATLARLRALVESAILPVLISSVQTQADFRNSLAGAAAIPTRMDHYLELFAASGFQPLRFDSPQTDLDSAADRVRAMMTAAFPREKVQEIATDAFNRSQALHREQQAGQLRHSTIGINIFQETTDLIEQSRAFVRVNTRQITRLNDESISRIERVVSEGIRFGRRGTDVARSITDELRREASKALRVLTPNPAPESIELAAQVMRELEIAENRAEFIARDQIAKANADLSRSRQEANGVTKFIWRTLGDERVRPTHVARDDRTFSWADGSGGIYPGQDPNCRCYAEAVL